MPHFENIRIETFDFNDSDTVAGLLTDAFENNPAYNLIFEHTGKLREGLSWLFKTNLYLINRKKILTRIIRENHTGNIIGTYTLIPPTGLKPCYSDYFKIGLPRFILKFGFTSLIKMLEMDSLNKKSLEGSIRVEKYYYLSMVVIKKEYRGKGIGTLAIKNCLDELMGQREKNCNVVGLTTQLPENVVFYSKSGFLIASEGNVNYRDYCYYNCNMAYPFPQT